MSILNILIHPNKKLRIKADIVKNINDDIKNIVLDMFETMYFNNGIGLAATQVDINKQIITIDIKNNKLDQIVLINPKIIKKSKFINSNEGCLSVPNFYYNIIRYKNIIVEALDINSKKVVMNVNNLLSICIQHEIDHLNGILFIDYIKEDYFRK